MYHTSPDSGAMPAGVPMDNSRQKAWLGHGMNAAQGAALSTSQDTLVNALIRDIDVALDQSRQINQLQAMFLERVFGPTPETAGGLRGSDPCAGLAALLTEKIQLLHQLLSMALSNQNRIDKTA